MAMTEIKAIPFDKVKQQNCVPFNKPVLIKGGCIDMLALRKWKDKEYLKEKFGDCPVDL